MNLSEPIVFVWSSGWKKTCIFSFEIGILASCWPWSLSSCRAAVPARGAVKGQMSRDMGCLETLHLVIQEIPGNFSTLSAPDNRTIAIGIPSHNQLAFMAQVYGPKLRREELRGLADEEGSPQFMDEQRRIFFWENDDHDDQPLDDLFLVLPLPQRWYPLVN